MTINSSVSEVQREFFNQEKNRYDVYLITHQPLHTRLEIKCIVKRIPNNNQTGYVVDFGSGNGRITIELLKLGFNVIAIDVSEESLSALKQMVGKFGYTGFKTSTALSKRHKVTTIVGADILHHVDLDWSLSRIYLALKKKGKVIFSEPGAFNISWYIYLPIVSSWSVEKGIVNCSYFNLIDKFKKYGFKKIKITGLGLFPRPFFNLLPFICRLNDWLGNLPIFKLFAYRYIIEATK